MRDPWDNPRLFNYRPLVVAAMGFGTGIFLGEISMGTGSLAVLCLFCALLLLSLLFHQQGQTVFLGFLLLGLMRLWLFYAVDAGPFLARLAPLASPLHALRAHLLESTDTLFTDNAPLIRAMLWGDTSLLTDLDYEAFRTAGVAHVLALSGLHVSFLAAAFLWVLPARRPRLRFFAVGTFLLLYCAIAAFPPSLVRASVMLLCYLGASLCDRRGDILCSLSLAALIILLFAPEALFRAGFQLSFAAVLGIALLQPVFLKLFARLPATLAQSLAVTLSATLGTLCITMARFGTLPLYVLPANFFLLPLIPFILIPAFVGVLLYPLLPFAARGLAFIAYYVTDILKGLSVWISDLPHSDLVTPKAGLLFCMTYFLILLVCSPYLLRGRRFRLCALACLVPLLLLVGVWGGMV